MPLIQVKLTEGVFSPEQKAELIQRLTDAVVAVKGEGLRSVTWVVLEEVQQGHWGVGGLSSRQRSSMPESLADPS